MSRRKKLFVLTGAVLSCVFLGAIIWRLDWAVFVNELSFLSPEWLVAVFVCFSGGVCLRALRWSVLLDTPPNSYRRFWEATSLGLAMNQIYPFRVGEVIRILAIKRFLQLPLGNSVISAVVDRFGDVMLLGLSVVMLTFSYVDFPHAEIVRQVLAVAAVAAGGLALVLGRASGRDALRALIRLAAKRSTVLHERMEGFYDDSLATLSGMLQPRRWIMFVVVTLGVFAIDCGAFLCAAKAFGWELPWLAAVTLWLFLGVGTSLPSAPAYVGVFQVACVLALGLFGMNDSQGMAYSVVVQMLSFSAVLLMAGLALVGHKSDVAVVRDALDRA